MKETLGIVDGQSQDVDADIFGYVKDWEQISRRYRELKNTLVSDVGCRLQPHGIGSLCKCIIVMELRLTIERKI